MPGGNLYQKGDFLHRVEFGNEFNATKELLPQPILISSDGNLISASYSNLPISLKKILVESKTIDDEGSEKVPHAEIVIHAQAFNGQQAHIRCMNDINELKIFLDAIKQVSTDHNLDTVHLEPIRTETLTAIYENNALMFSALRERKLRFALVWKEWKPRIVKIYSNGTISYAQPKQVNLPRHKCFSLKKVTATLMKDESLEEGGEDNLVNIGLIVKCQTLDGIESYFRCIMNHKELDAFLIAIRTVSEEHNLDKLQEAQLEVKKAKKSSVLNIFRSKASIMRRAVSSAMDKYDRRTKRERILSKRAAFKWLPVVGANDLIHGSWWFVGGSLGGVITTAVVIHNKYAPLMNDDDSDLTLLQFEESWGLLLLSMLFSTLGSLAFVRAFNEDPPMRPLFHKWYHTQSDELLASWLFFFACLPAIPYVFIYVVEYNYGFIYLVMLVFAVIAALGALLFVRACYPVDNPKVHRDLMLPVTNYLCCCCCSEAWRKHHFMNDWLGGCWVFYWLCLFATPPMFIIFCVAVANRNVLQMFVYGTSTLENIAFTIGSACFVAGSYPEGYNESQLDTSQTTTEDAVYNPTLEQAVDNHEIDGDDLEPVRLGLKDFVGHQKGYSKVIGDV